jgi:hypothetical protein
VALRVRKDVVKYSNDFDVCTKKEFEYPTHYADRKSNWISVYKFGISAQSASIKLKIKLHFLSCISRGVKDQFPA